MKEKKDNVTVRIYYDGTAYAKDIIADAIVARTDRAMNEKTVEMPADIGRAFSKIKGISKIDNFNPNFQEEETRLLPVYSKQKMKTEDSVMKWVSAFKYISINYDARIATVKDRTQRVSFANNLYGNRIRLRFSNRYGKTPLRLDRVTVGTESGGTVLNTTPVTLNDSPVITLEPGQEVFSDEIAFAAHAGERLAVNIYVKDAQNVENVCCFWARTNTRVSFGAGDQTDGQAFEETEPDNLLPLIKNDPSPYKTMFFYGFDALQVYTEDDVKVIAAFGDSITHMSFVTNALMKRLYAAYPGKVALINSGVSGNRLVHDATYIKAIGQVVPVFGEAGIKRFEKDVFELDEVNTVLALIGINDIMHPIQLEELTETTPPEAIIDGYKTIAAITHTHGGKIFGATVMPCGNECYPEGWLPAFEKTRQSLNEWIRGENDYDGFFDYDAAMRDDARPGYLLPGLDIGDGLHPNDKGGEIVANTIDLAQLTGMCGVSASGTLPG